MKIIRNFKYTASSIVIMAGAALSAQASSLSEAVDENFNSIARATEIGDFVPVASIDHAKLAAAEGVEMPPSRVQIFSDPAVNTPILKENIRAGLDLPFRVLAYAQDDTANVIFTGAEFLQIRHGLNDDASLEKFAERLSEVTREVGGNAAPTENLRLDYGVIELTTDLDVASAAANLTKIVESQNDTVWFGEINFAAEASAEGVELPEAVLLLFGGPAPGGVAMADYPAIGLDAFCQKLLVYAAADGGSVVIYNDIAALAELYYGSSAKPHHVLNERLIATFQKAIE